MERAEIVALSKQYLEDVLTFFDLNIEVEVVIEDDVVVVRVPSTERNSLLIGKNAETLRSLQHLLASMLRNKNASVHRVNVDIADYKKQHAEKIAEKARGWIEEVRRTGERKTIELNAADRWVVHHVASEYADIETHSEGEGRARQLIIAQKSS